MNISKTVGLITGGIPIVGILIGTLTFGINFKSDVDSIKDDVAHQETVNAEVAEWFNSIPDAYDDTLLWNAVDNIVLPEEYDDSALSTKLTGLAIDLASLQVEVDSIEVGDTSALQAQVSELAGQLSAMANIDMTSDDGSVDLGPLIVRIATVEGSMDSIKSSIDTIKSDIRTMKTDITTLERQPTSSGSTRQYDDSELRSRISAVERQVNSIPATNNSGNTVQRVENPFDDSSLRNDISALQTAVAVLQATPGQSYDDSDLWDRIDDIQWELENMDVSTVSSNTTDTSWLEDLIYQIKDELTWRIDELEWASDNTTTSDDMYVEKWQIENLEYEVFYIQEQVWELQTLINNSSSTSSNNTANPTPTPSSPNVGRTWDGAWNEPYGIHVNHVDNSTNHSYTGDYWLDGYWNGEAVWTNWNCGIPPWDICHIYKYNHTSWVLQPSEPGNEWLANAFNDNGVWPWEGTWSGDVNFVDKIDD